MDAIDEIDALPGGVATWAQLAAVVGRSRLEIALRDRRLHRVWPGVYSRREPDLALRLAGLDLRAGEPVAVCLATAAALHGFDTERDTDVHILNPLGHQLRPSAGLVVHRREGAHLTTVGDRPATTPAWTAVEIARSLRRPRALATLDSALRTGRCSRSELWRAAIAQAGRRGIVPTRQLLDHADGRAESPMESETRLRMIDAGLPAPELQFELVDLSGQRWRLDFAWPDAKLAVEYDGVDWHTDPDAFRRDRQKRLALADLGWTVLCVVADDVRRRPAEMVRRIGAELSRPQPRIA